MKRKATLAILAALTLLIVRTHGASAQSNEPLILTTTEQAPIIVATGALADTTANTTTDETGIVTATLIVTKTVALQGNEVVSQSVTTQIVLPADLSTGAPIVVTELVSPSLSVTVTQLDSAVTHSTAGATPEAKANRGANLRGGPGTSYAVVGKVLAGNALEIVAQNSDGSWYQLASGEWIAAFLVDNAPADLPVADAPAPVSAQRVHTLAGVPLTIQLVAPGTPPAGGAKKTTQARTQTMTVTAEVESWVTLAGTEVLSTVVEAALSPEEATPSPVTLGPAALTSLEVSGPAATGNSSAIGAETSTETGKVTDDQAKQAQNHYKRGKALTDKEDYAGAILEYDQAAALDPYEAAIYTARAQAHGALGDYEQAIDDANRAIVLAPDDALNYFLRGVTYYFSGDPEKAIPDLTKSIELDPSGSNTYDIRGRAYYQIYEWQKVVDDYTRFIELVPDNPDGYAKRASALERLGNYDLAIQDYDQAIALTPDDAGLYNNRALIHAFAGEFDAALKDMATDAKLSGGELAAGELDTRGFVYLSMANYKAAMKDYNAAIAGGFDSSYPKLGLGITYAHMEKMEQALPLIQDGLAGLKGEEAAGFDPELKQLVAWATEIISKESTGDASTNGVATEVAATAEMTLTEATVTTTVSAVTRIAPGSAAPVVDTLPDKKKITLVGRNAEGGWVQMNNGAWLATYLVSDVPDGLPVVDVPLQLDLAGLTPAVSEATAVTAAAELTVDQLTTAIAANPDQAANYNNRGTLYLQAGQLSAAIADFDQAITLTQATAQKTTPEPAEAYNNRGLAHYEQGDTQQAVKDLKAAISLNPKLAQAYFNLGNVLFNNSDVTGARDAYDHAVKLQPDYPRAIMHRGIVNDILGNSDAALADMSKAIKLDPTIGEAFYNRGVTYFTLGKYNLAIADFLQATQLDPTYVAAYYNLAAIHYNLAQYDEVIEDATQAIDKLPAASAYDLRARAHNELKQYTEAIKDLDAAIALEPDFADLYIERAFNQGFISDWLAVLLDTTTALSLDPNSAEAYYIRSFAYSQIGKTDLAIQDLESYLPLEKDPSLRENAQKMLAKLRQQ